MNRLFETIILYIVLFLSGSIGQAAIAVSKETLAVSIGTELYRIFMYNLPSLALLWYLIYRGPRFRLRSVKPHKDDLVAAAICLPALMLTGLSVALISPQFSGIPQGAAVIPPSGLLTWLVLIFSCITTGYLEESYFRYYLLTRHEDLGIGPFRAVLVSTLLFAICHIYEGPWGFLNAVLSGFLLGFIFLRYKSLHGIAVAHGMYNVFVYAMAAL